MSSWDFNEGTITADFRFTKLFLQVLGVRRIDKRHKIT